MLVCSLCVAASAVQPHAWAQSELPQKRFPVYLVNGPDYHRVREILADHSIRRENKSRFNSTRKVYRYLINRLPLAGTLIRILKFGNYKITENPDGTLTVDNQDGLVLKVGFHVRTEEQLVSYVEGVYRSWWTTGIHGRGAIWVRFIPGKAETHPEMENDFLGFIKFNNPVVEFVAKVVDFFLRRMTDREIEKGQNAGKSLTELLARDPGKVYATMRKSPEISPRELKEFREIFLTPGVQKRGEFVPRPRPGARISD